MCDACECQCNSDGATQGKCLIDFVVATAGGRVPGGSGFLGLLFSLMTQIFGPELPLNER